MSMSMTYYEYLDRFGVPPRLKFGKYSGKPVSGGEVFEKFVKSKSAELDDISDAVSNLNRSSDILDSAIWRRSDCAAILTEKLIDHFADHAGWNADSAECAIEDFEEKGFSSVKARDLAMLIRNMFFDDRQAMFRSLKCVGLFSEDNQYGVDIGCVFEDAKTGNQFAVTVPFTKKPCCRPLFRADFMDEYFPVYFVKCPGDGFFESRIAISHYDLRVMRAEIEKFAAGGYAIPSGGSSAYYPETYYDQMNMPRLSF